MKNSELVWVEGKVYHLGLKPEQLTPNIIVVGDPARAQRVAAKFNHIDYQVTHREYLTISGYYNQLPITVIGTGIGTDNLEIALIEAYGLLALHPDQGPLKDPLPSINIIRVGTSGGIQEEISAGTLAISNYALGLDSTGLYYDHPPADDTVIELEHLTQQILLEHTVDSARFKGKLFPYASKAGEKLVKILINEAHNQQVSYQTGITVSAPGFYGPSGRFIEGLSNTIPHIKAALATLKYQELQIINMEMESSLLFHLGHELGINVASICVIISNPFRHEIIKDHTEAIDQAIEIALHSLVKISGS